MIQPYKYSSVAAHVRRMIAEVEGEPVPSTSELTPFQHLLLALLARPGRVLAPHGSAKWPAFVIETCVALGGTRRAAVGAAAAVEFALAAADVVDDLVDDDWDNELALEEPLDMSTERAAMTTRPTVAATWRRTTNAGPALLSLAHYSLYHPATGLAMRRACRVASILSRGYLAACVGEDLDLQFESVPEVSEEAAYDMTRRKSGSLVAMACEIGAAVALEDEATQQLAAEFGRHVGIVGQLLNDIIGVGHDAKERSTDLRRRKQTLPVAYALRCAREEGCAPLLAWYAAKAEGIRTGDEPYGDDPHAAASRAYGTEDGIAELIRTFGGAYYAWTIAEVHRQLAHSTLQRLADVTHKAQVHRLSRLIPNVELTVTAPETEASRAV